MILLEKNVPLYYEVSVAAMLLQLSFTPMHCRIAQQVTVAVFVQYCPKISTGGPRIVLFLRTQGTVLLTKPYYSGTDLVLK